MTSSGVFSCMRVARALECYGLNLHTRAKRWFSCGFLACVCEAIRTVLRVGAQDAESLLQGSDLLFAHSHTVCVAHACVDACRLEFHQLLDAGLEDSHLIDEVILCIRIVLI